MDEAIRLLRAYWGDEKVDFAGKHYTADAIAMEPKPPQGARLPVWVGGGSPRALRRAGELGDGWMATGTLADSELIAAVGTVKRHAEESGRDPADVGLQLMLASPPRDEAGKTFYADTDRVVRRAEEIDAMGFDWTAVNATALFQSGARSVSAMVDALGALHGRLRAAVG